MSDTNHLIINEIMYHAGDKFQCWRCDARLFEIVRDIRHGDTLHPVDFNFIAGQKVVAGMKMECSHCGQAWYSNYLISAKKVIETWN